ncbi:MAG: hypothetical protein RML94_15590 [Bacteroidia bacterium]|nr:hypothetical protein [Bacteroidia bacterium]
MSKNKIIITTVLIFAVLCAAMSKEVNKLFGSQTIKTGHKYKLLIEDSLLIKTFNPVTSFEIIGNKIFCGCPFYLIEYSIKGEYIRTYEGLIRECPTGKEKRNKKIPMRLDTWGYDTKNEEVYVWSNYDECFYIYKSGILKRKLAPSFAKDKYLAIERGRKGIFITDSLLFLSTLPYQTSTDSNYSVITFLDKVNGKTKYVLKDICYQPNNVRRIVNIDFDGIQNIVYISPSNEPFIYAFDIQNNKKVKFGTDSITCLYANKQQNQSVVNLSLKYNSTQNLLFRTIMTGNQNKENYRHADVLEIYKNKQLVQQMPIDKRFSDIVYVSPDLEIWLAGKYNAAFMGTFLYKTKLIAEN